MGNMFESYKSEKFPNATVAFGTCDTRTAQDILDNAPCAAPEHDRALEHDRAAHRRNISPFAPRDAPGRWLYQSHATRSSVVFPEPFGPITTVGGPQAKVSVTWSRI